MDHCMNSFQIRLQGASTIASGDPATSIRTWGTLGQYYFSLDWTAGGTGSIYNIEGFKNVDIYGAGVSGIVQGYSVSTNKCAVVTDWGMSVALNGNPPLIAGKTSTVDAYGIVTTGTGVCRYLLSKNTNLISLNNPISSVKSISFFNFHVQGIGAEFLNQISLYYDLNFTFYYKYEGEND